MNKIISISVRLATPDDKHLDSYDNTKLQAFNTCPTWGIVRYQMHKTYQTNSRAMALEAGGAMHELFAAARLWQLVYHTLRDNPLNQEFMSFHGLRLFGPDRWPAIEGAINKEEDERTNYINFCLAALYSSGFYDDPGDRRRTMSNLEEAGILYLDRYDLDRMCVWVRDPSDPTSDVGIEVAFDLVITYEFQDGNSSSYRFVGKFDGIMVRDGEIILGENKTGSRIDMTWASSFLTSSQITGYLLAITTWTQTAAEKAIIYGVQIPLPKSVDLGGITTEHVSRESYMFKRWFDWFLYTARGYEAYRDNPIDAPKFTHSCNRYFRPCSLIPFCASPDEDQYAHLEEMVHNEWSPLHDNEGKASD